MSTGHGTWPQSDHRIRLALALLQEPCDGPQRPETAALPWSLIPVQE